MIARIIEAALAVIGYCGIAGGVGQLMPWDDDSARVLAGLAWPISLPLRIGWRAIAFVRERAETKRRLPMARVHSEGKGNEPW